MGICHKGDSSPIAEPSGSTAAAAEVAAGCPRLGQWWTVMYSSALGTGWSLRSGRWWRREQLCGGRGEGLYRSLAGIRTSRDRADHCTVEGKNTELGQH